MRRRTRRILIGSVSLLVLAGVAGPFVYSWLGDEPPSLVQQRLVSNGQVMVADATGRWTAGDGSVVGYRVQERIGLADLVAVGRTTDVTGEVEVDGGSLTAVEFEVDMATLRSDRSQRDDQFRTRIMDVARYPSATFRLTTPVRLPATVSATDTIEVTGDLRLRDVTRSVTFGVHVTVVDDRLHLTGDTTIVFRDWNIPNPSVPEAFVYTDDSGTLEFDIVLDPAD